MVYDTIWDHSGIKVLAFILFLQRNVFIKLIFSFIGSQLSKEKWTEKETKNQGWSEDRIDKIAVGVWRIWKWGVEQQS